MASPRKFCQLVSSDYIFANTVIDNNVDPELINKFIIQGQEINIQTVLGNSLYTKLMKDCYEENITGNYLILLKDYVQRALGEWTVYHALPFVNYKLTNKAVSERNSDNSNPTELSTIQYLRDNVRDSAEFYTQRIRDFVINNQANYPEYYSASGIAEIRPKRNNYFQGIYLPDNDCGCPGPNPGNSKDINL